MERSWCKALCEEAHLDSNRFLPLGRLGPRFKLEVLTTRPRRRFSCFRNWDIANNNDMLFDFYVCKAYLYKISMNWWSYHKAPINGMTEISVSFSLMVTPPVLLLKAIIMHTHASHTYVE